MPNNVTTILLQLLIEEEANVAGAEEKVTECLAVVEHHRKRICQIRAALEALGVDVEDSKSIKEITD